MDSGEKSSEKAKPPGGGSASHPQKGCEEFGIH
jgi:hypothetical protein